MDKSHAKSVDARRTATLGAVKVDGDNRWFIGREAEQNNQCGGNEKARIRLCHKPLAGVSSQRVGKYFSNAAIKTQQMGESLVV